jgi:hypothetical protein
MNAVRVPGDAVTFEATRGGIREQYGRLSHGPGLGKQSRRVGAGGAGTTIVAQNSMVISFSYRSNMSSIASFIATLPALLM